MERHDEEDPGTLGLVYDNLVRGRDRLRDAQRAVTSQLGPLPTSASAVIALLATVGFEGDLERADRYWLAGIAVGVSLVIAAISIWAIKRPPYREDLAADALKSPPKPIRLSEAEWLRERIDSESPLYERLEAAFNKQHLALRCVQGLLAVEALVVVVGAIALA
jgi:hypothetical protein